MAAGCAVWRRAAVLLVGVLAFGISVASGQIVAGTGGGIGAGYPSGTEAPAPPTPPVVQQPPKYSVSGSVVNAVTGESIPHALVQFDPVHIAFTDQNGQFTVEQVPEGQYPVQAFKPGFLRPWDESSDRDFVHVDRRLETVTIRLTPEALIKGDVVDEDGDGIPGVTVLAKCARVEDGRKNWGTCATAFTDEDGEFRLVHLPPRSYYLVASAGVRQVPDDSNSDGPRKGYGQEYLPTQEGSAHGTMEVRAGARLNVRFHLRKEPVFNIYGVLTGLPPNAPAALQLKDGNDDPLSSDFQVEPVSGSFVVRGVAPGTYKLHAVAHAGGMPRSSGDVPVTVAKGDVTDLTLALHAGVNIPIEVHLEASHPAAENRVGTTVVSGAQWPPNTPYVPVCLKSNFNSLCSSVEVKDGVPKLQLKGVQPGRYRVEINPAGMLYASSATYNGADALHDEIAVDASNDGTPIEVTIRDDIALLKCGLQSAQKTPFWLLVVEDDGRRSFLQKSAGGELSTYIPPGEYKVYAFDRVDGLEFRNPDVLREYATSAMPLALAPNDQRTVNLDVIARGAQ